MQGSERADRWSVAVTPGDNWAVTDSVAGRSYVVDTAAQPHPWDGSIALPDFASINQYGVPVNTIRFQGGAGNDDVALTSSVTTGLIAYGQDGNDTIIGGSGQDFIYGWERG